MSNTRSWPLWLLSMAKTKLARCARQAAWIVLVIVAAFAVLALIDAGLQREDRCSYQFPKFLGCVVAKHETLLASLIGLAAALFAAMKAWAAIMRQIAADRKNTRDAERAYVTGGPGIVGLIKMEITSELFSRQ